TDQGQPVAGNAYWQGKLLHIPGVTSETFLETSAGEQITKSNFRVSGCIENPDGQQGIVVAGPNGLTYTFNQIKSYYNGKPALKDPIVRTRLLMVTRIEDRFGNHVDYAYTDGNLTGISASDGRAISIVYSTGLVTASANGREWKYHAPIDGAYDLRVTLPDNASTWEYDNVDVTGFQRFPVGGYNQRFQMGYGLTPYVPGCGVTNDQYVVTIKAPTGLVSTYTFKDTIHYRSDVEPELYQDGFIDYWLSRTLNCTISRALVAKSIAGPGIPTSNWTYQYSSNKGTYSDSTALNDFLTGPFDLPTPAQGGYPEPITAGTAVDYRSTTVTGPERKVVFYIDRKFHSITENRVVAQDTLNASGTVLLKRTLSEFEQDEEFLGNHWYMCPCDGIYPPVNFKQLSYRIHQTKSVEKRYLSGGIDTYTTTSSAFDDYGFALQSTESNTGSGNTRSIARSYLHDTGNGLIGLPLKEVVDGTIVSENHYNTLGQKDWTKVFGKLKSIFTYDNSASVASGQRGTIKTVKDGNNNVTTFSNWKRGIPQTLQYADGESRSGVVDDNGWVVALTDENGYTRAYTYD